MFEDAQLIKIFNNKAIFLRANGQQEVLYLRPKDAQLDPTYTTAYRLEECGTTNKRRHIHNPTHESLVKK